MVCKMTCILFLVTLIMCVTKIKSAKVLAVLPIPSISHHIFYRHITQELVKRGHQVTVITPDPAYDNDQLPENYTEIDIHKESYSVFPRGSLSSSVGKKSDIYTQMQQTFNTIITMFETQMKNNEVRNLFAKRFDLIIIEACNRPSVAFSSIFKAPVIMMSTFAPMIGFEGMFGAPYHPLLYPNFAQQSLYDLTIWEKVREVYLNFWTHHMFIDIERKENEMLQRVFGRDIPKISELRRNIDMMFVNVHPMWIDNQPMPPNVLFMGGLHKQSRKDLPEDLQTYLDSSQQGVIYVSFGTNVLPSELMPEKLEIMKKVFSELPYNILWKWNKDEIDGLSDNIKISKSFPQTDILRHPKVKLFITQGGQQSTDEAIEAEVPVIGIPMLLDQWYNSEKYERHKIGVKLDFEELTADKFRNAIYNVIKDKRCNPGILWVILKLQYWNSPSIISYRENIRKIKSLINDTPQKPLDHVMWWIEYVLRHGGAGHLRSPAANISWAQYLELELIFGLFAVILVAIFMFILVLYSIYCLICNRCVFSAKQKTC